MLDYLVLIVCHLMLMVHPSAPFDDGLLLLSGPLAHLAENETRHYDTVPDHSG